MYLGCGHIPSRGWCKRQLIDDSLSSMFLTLYSSLFISVKKSIKYIFKNFNMKLALDYESKKGIGEVIRNGGKGV